MNQERKDEIGNLFLLNKKTSKEELDNLEIQEIIFLIYSAQHFKENKEFLNSNFDKKIEIFFAVLKDKIKEAKDLYIAYDKNTNYPFMDNSDRVWIFSKEEYAKGAEDYFAQQLIMLEMKKIDSEEVINELVKLHTLGIEKILLDNGSYSAEINRDDILPPTDWSNTPEINIPVLNPKLQHAMIRFFQTLYSKNNYEGKEQVIHQLESTMLGEIIDAKYLLPVKLKENEVSVPDEHGNIKINKDTTMEFATLGGEDNTTWLPAFTDWSEFEKTFDKEEWKSYISTYEDLVSLSENMDGIVVNCNGIPLRINEQNKKMIEEYKKERDKNISSLSESTVEEGTKLMLGEPKEYPTEMIEAVKEYMKSEKCIKKAYLRLMIKENEKSYLIVVDFTDKKGEVFKEIADVAVPHLNGMFLDMISVDELGEEAISGVEPFYKKKAFGIF